MEKGRRKECTCEDTAIESVSTLYGRGFFSPRPFFCRVVNANSTHLSPRIGASSPLTSTKSVYWVRVPGRTTRYSCNAAVSQHVCCLHHPQPQPQPPRQPWEVLSREAELRWWRGACSCCMISAQPPLSSPPFPSRFRHSRSAILSLSTVHEGREEIKHTHTRSDTGIKDISVIHLCRHASAVVAAGHGTEEEWGEGGAQPETFTRLKRSWIPVCLLRRRGVDGALLLSPPRLSFLRFACVLHSQMLLSSPLHPSTPPSPLPPPSTSPSVLWRRGGMGRCAGMLHGSIRVRARPFMSSSFSLYERFVCFSVETCTCTRVMDGCDVICVRACVSSPFFLFGGRVAHMQNA